MTKYYSLLILDSISHLWGIQFGDYSKKVVEQERVDSYGGIPPKRWLIIATGDTQAEINARVKELNDEIREERIAQDEDATGEIFRI